MKYDHINVPAEGEAITVNADNSLNVPDMPIIPYIEGDGIGVDVTPVMLNVVEAAVETGGIVTAEEHTIYGGFGSAVAEVVATTHPVPMRILGVPGVFAPTGSPEFLFEHFGLTPQGIRDAALELVELQGS